jgi:hypothetical protein
VALGTARNLEVEQVCDMAGGQMGVVFRKRADN